MNAYHDEPDWVFMMERIGCSRWAGKCKIEERSGMNAYIETAEANGLEPYAYLRHVFKELPAAAESVEAMEALLPWHLSPTVIETGT
jgi:hypothetical protein